MDSIKSILNNLVLTLNSCSSGGMQVINKNSSFASALVGVIVFKLLYIFIFIVLHTLRCGPCCWRCHFCVALPLIFFYIFFLFLSELHLPATNQDFNASGPMANLCRAIISLKPPPRYLCVYICRRPPKKKNVELLPKAELLYP